MKNLNKKELAAHLAPETEMNAGKLTTDTGTIVLHWITAIAFIISLFTGIRVAADALVAPVSKWLSPILPQGEIWSWHFLSGLALFFCVSAYSIYVVRARLTQRNSLKKLRVLKMKAPSKMRWGAINVAMHWFVYGLIVVLTATGVIMYLGHGGIWVTIHSYAAFIGLAYVFAHIFSHFIYGGLQQLLRLFRPAQLRRAADAGGRPVLVSMVAGVLFAGAVAAVDWASRDTLVIPKVTEAPKLDGVLDDAVWGQARPVTIHTQQGENLGGSGESTVTVRAVQDGQKIYFAFQWEDPSRSYRRVPLIKKADGWYTMDPGNDRADVNMFYEDKFAALFSNNPSLGGAGATGFGPDTLPNHAKTPNERGLHYTQDGSYVDVWQWKASRGGVLGRVDDQYFGPPREPTKDEKEGRARYQGGYWNDPGRAFYSYNNSPEIKGQGGRPVTLKRLPKDVQAQVAKLGKFDLNPNSSDEEGARWFMTEEESEPYTAEADAKIPVGTILPGVLIMGQYEGDRADLNGAAKWKDGKWTLETVRNLTTGSKYDKDFVPGSNLYMWVAVFDHTQTRHTRHSRPVRVMLQ